MQAGKAGGTLRLPALQDSPPLMIGSDGSTAPRMPAARIHPQAGESGSGKHVFLAVKSAAPATIVRFPLLLTRLSPQ